MLSVLLKNIQNVLRNLAESTTLKIRINIVLIVAKEGKQFPINIKGIEVGQ